MGKVKIAQNGGIRLASPKIIPVLIKRKKVMNPKMDNTKMRKTEKWRLKVIQNGKDPRRANMAPQGIRIL